MPNGIVVPEELGFLGILEWNEHHRVAAGRHHAPGHPYHGVIIATDCKAVAHLETGGYIDHCFVVSTCYLAPGDQVGWPAGCCARTAGRDADHHRAHFILRATDLHGQIGHVCSLGYPRHGQKRAIYVIVDAGRFRIGTEGVLLYYPEVGATVVQQCLAVINHAPVDPGHYQGNTDQQAQADAGKDEFSPGVENIATGQADHRDTPGMVSNTLIRLRAVNDFSLYTTIVSPSPTPPNTCTWPSRS